MPFFLTQKNENNTTNLAMPPSKEELQTVCGLHDRLIEGIYKRAPIYRKIFLGRFPRICQ